MRTFKIVLFILSLLCLGFFRENLFVSVNGLLYNKYYNPIGYEIHSIRPAFRFLDVFSYQTLYTAKWCITPLFLLFFWFIQKKFLWLLFHEKNTNTWLRVLYLSLFLFAGISFFTGWLIGHIHDGYRFSRIFIGLLESPVPCMILIPITYFYKNYNTKT